MQTGIDRLATANRKKELISWFLVGIFSRQLKAPLLALLPVYTPIVTTIYKASYDVYRFTLQSLWSLSKGRQSACNLYVFRINRALNIAL